MPYDFIEFRNTMIKPYYRADIEDNKNTAIASNDEQMLLNEKEFSNDQKKATDQPPKFQHTGVSAAALNAIDLGAVIFDADASNATAPDASN